MSHQNHREEATIAAVSSTGGDEDSRGIPTCWITCEGPGWGQGFGGLYLDGEARQHFERDVCETFGVGAFYDLVGKRCFVLRNFAFQDLIGLESRSTGYIFTIHGFRQRWCDMGEANPLQDRRASIIRDIELYRRRIKEQEQELLKVEGKYVRWEEKRP